MSCARWIEPSCTRMTAKRKSDAEPVKKVTINDASISLSVATTLT